MNKEIVGALTSRAGEYEGQGINHEGQPFIGYFSILPVVKDHGVSIAFKATGLVEHDYPREEKLAEADHS